ncbi:MAG: SLC13 family permease [Thermoplasmata archaeon]|jgi:Na+/H+ antiporter NhaD and related arsenite permeases|nr:anion transporter [Euryarchaeota archaeon]MVT36318.1 anion transporter [Euryarchaeota archaeon]
MDLIGLSIFLLTYALISIRRKKGYRITRPTAALLGASLMMIFGVITIDEAISAIDLNIIFLLIGMMSIVSIFQFTGFFEWIISRIVKFSKTSGRLFILISISTAFFSALFVNDAVVLFFTPIILAISRDNEINPEPFLLSEIFSANIGSVATEIGNPQNAYIAIKSSIPFFYYFIVMLPVAIISLIISILIIYIFYKDTMNKKLKSYSLEKGIKNKKLFYSATITLVLILFSFIFERNIAIVPFIGASILLFVSPFISDADPRKIIKEIDWGIILFFVGLFIVLEGVLVSGILSEMINVFNSYGLNLNHPLWYVTFVAVVSNLVSNVPAVMLISPITTGKFWLLLAMSSTLAGNATIIGAAANIIVLEISSVWGIEISWGRFSKVGIPVTIITILLGTLILVF